MSSPLTLLVPPQTWMRDGNTEYVISTDPALLSVPAVNAAFAMDFLYWSKPFPEEEVLRSVLYSSVNFGVYKRLQPLPHTDPSEKTDVNNTSIQPDNVEQIGLARMVTDGATFGYLTDVYILPDYQGHGLGRWLMECVVETFSTTKMPHLRRIMLITGDEHVQEFYKKMFGMEVVGHEMREDMGKMLTFMCARG